MVKILKIFLLIFLTGCVTQFVPETEEAKELLVVEAMITDMPGINTVKLSKSIPFGKKSEAKPLEGCSVNISDNNGNNYSLTEHRPGIYLTDSTSFRGQKGLIYTLHITERSYLGLIHYESDPVEMIPAPPVDSIYYEKVVVKKDYLNYFGIDACQIYLDTHDPQNKCRYFRWDYDETWVLNLLFPVKNNKCWVSDTSKTINIKSTAAFEESKVVRQPVAYISNSTDRLLRKYSISVNQYSLSENEYVYWEKIKNLADQAGGLYDIIPSAVPGNITCIENPEEKVLGYFSVSSRTSKRFFIRDNFAGIIDQYPDCITGVVWGDVEIFGLDVSVWVLSDNPQSFGSPRKRILTDKKGCADCTVRGTNIKPPYWIGD